MPPLKELLSAGRPAIGSWITLGHPAIGEILAHAGFDWLAVDLEHTTISLDQAGEVIRAIDLCGVAPLVRLSANDPAQIKRVLDAGAHGIIVPMVTTAAEAEQAAAAVYYPPRGRRGVGLARAQGYGARFADYRRWLEAQAVVIVQVEHIEAVRNLEAILSVPGVDGYLIGPYDLSASLGLAGQLEHPEVAAAIRAVRETGARLGKPGGLHVVEPDPAQLRARLAEGFRFLAYSVDIRMLDTVARAGLAGLGR